jgi:hypothetical protein
MIENADLLCGSRTLHVGPGLAETMTDSVPSESASATGVMDTLADAAPTPSVTVAGGGRKSSSAVAVPDSSSGTVHT